MRNLTAHMTGNILTLLASAGTFAFAIVVWRSTFSRPAVIRVRTQPTLRRPVDDPSQP
jgi:hypothetical protein